VISLQQIGVNALDEDDVRILELLGNQIVLALNGVRLFTYLGQVTRLSGELITAFETRMGGLSGILQQIGELTGSDIVVLYPMIFKIHSLWSLGFVSPLSSTPGPATGVPHISGTMI
jgi:hypothetical protein